MEHIKNDPNRSQCSCISKLDTTPLVTSISTTIHQPTNTNALPADSDLKPASVQPPSIATAERPQPMKTVVDSSPLTSPPTSPEFANTDTLLLSCHQPSPSQFDTPRVPKRPFALTTTTPNPNPNPHNIPTSISTPRIRLRSHSQIHPQPLPRSRLSTPRRSESRPFYRSTPVSGRNPFADRENINVEDADRERENPWKRQRVSNISNSFLY